MRVTNSMIANNLMRNLSRNLGRMEKVQQQLASGKKFINPSDDPIGVSRSLRLNTEITTMSQYKRNADDVKSWLSTTEMAVSNISDILKRAGELTVEAVSETNSENERSAIAEEIRELKNQLVQIGNTTYAGSYLFSGFKTDKPLLAPDGSYDIGGDILTLDEDIEVNIGVGDRIIENFLGQRIFGLYSSAVDLDKAPEESAKQRQSMCGNPISASAAGPLAVSGSFTLQNGSDSVIVDITGSYTSLIDLAAAITGELAGTALEDPHVKVSIMGNKLVFDSDNKMTVQSASPDTNIGKLGMTNNQESEYRVVSGEKSQLIEVFDQLISGLESDDTAKISDALSRIESHTDNVNAIRAEIGVKTNRIELTTNRILDDTVNLKDLMSKNEDADIAEVIMNLKMEEYVYKASLSGGAKIIQPTLVDFLI